MSPLDRALALLLRALLALPAAVKRALAGRPVRRDGLELDLDAQLVLRLGELSPRPPLDGRTPAQARADLVRSTALVAGRPEPIAEVRELEVAGAAGPLRARLYAPVRAVTPLLVYFHGGGWVVGDLETHDATCRLLARAAGVRVLSVDYRLAPEHPYPAAIEDALAAFRDAAARAGELGADPARAGVGGDSAGGHLAAWVAQRAAREGGPAPVVQLLVYPATDFVEDRPSKALFAEGFLLTRPNIDWYERQFLQDLALREEASPLRAADLSGLAPAIVLTAGFDPLRDEGEEYAERLRAAGVPVVLRRHEGQVHGFFSMVGAGRAPREAVAETAGMLRAALSARR